MRVEDGTKLTPFELLNALNHGNTPKNRREAIRQRPNRLRAIEAITQDNLPAKVMDKLDRAVQAGWRKLGEPKPDEKLETADLFRTPQQK